MLQRPFEAIIFDCDGTLVDSEPITVGVLIEQVRELGLELEFKETHELFVGRDMPAIVDVLTTRLRSPLPNTFVEDFRERQATALKAELQAIDGAVELLESMTKTFCLASNAPREKIEINLEVTGLNRFFPEEAIFSAYDIQAWKPQPDLFLLAATKMGVDAADCVVIEDSPAGVEAGIAAGMQVIEYNPQQVGNLVAGVTRVVKLREMIPMLR